LTEVDIILVIGASRNFNSSNINMINKAIDIKEKSQLFSVQVVKKFLINLFKT